MKAYTDLEVDGIVVAEKFKTNGGTTSQLVQGDGGLIAKTTFATKTHNHSASNITSGTLAIARIPTGTSSTQVALGNHTHTIADVTNLQTELDGKADATHSHTIANVTNLQTELGKKADNPNCKTITLNENLFTVASGSGTHTATSELANDFANGYDTLLFNYHFAAPTTMGTVNILLGLGEANIRNAMIIGKLYTIILRNDQYGTPPSSITVNVTGYNFIPYNHRSDYNNAEKFEILNNTALTWQSKTSFDPINTGWSYSLKQGVVIQIMRVAENLVSVVNVSQPQIIY